MGDKKDHRASVIKSAVLLNICFSVIELMGGLWTNSLAILSDALHDFGDSIALVSSWLFERKASKAPDSQRTFGYQRLSLFSAGFAALILVAGSVLILVNAIPKLLTPEPVNAHGMMGIALLGVLFNGIGFYRLKTGESLNERVLSWHLFEDVVGWIIILISSITIRLWDLHVIDPLLTVGLTIFIMYNALKHLGEAFNILLEGVPKHIDIEKVRNELTAVHGIKAVHDLHIWSLDGKTDIFTGHIVVEDELLLNADGTRRIIKNILNQNHIEHSTIELESEEFCSGIECQLSDYQR
jgi:cobalt-zinc-cadmium efflux system protein